MPLVNGYTLLDIIKERKVIAGAFNTTNLETTVGILQAVEKSGIPTFIQVAPTNISLAGYDYLVDMVSRYAENMDTPIALHLDHGKKFEDVKKAIRAGFTSVMIDGAAFDFEENIAFTKKAVDFAKAYGVPVEAELGAILGKEDDHVSEADCKTDPTQVKEFVERTGCDMLAISVGNVHGLEDEPKIDFSLLKEINEVSPVPLVIHGGSGIPDEHIQQMVNYNVAKINIASDLRQSYIRSVGRAYESNPNEANLIKVLQHAEDSVLETVYNKILNMNSVVQKILSTSLTELENIFVDLKVNDFNELIPLLAQPLIKNEDVVESFPNQVIDREHTFPTGLPTQPYGVAIPHTDAEFVINNKVTIATLKTPIQMEVMGGMNDEKIDVSIIFLLALGHSNKQLNVLQKLMGILNQEDVLTKIKNGTKEEIYKIAKEEIQL